MGGLFGKPKKKVAGGVKIKGAPPSQQDYPAFKMLMIGDPAVRLDPTSMESAIRKLFHLPLTFLQVGKSSLLLRYADNEFTSNFISTIGVDYKEKEVQVNGAKVNIQIWDTAGQERFRTITSSYYRGAHGMILCFDLGNEQSFKSLSKWLQEVERYAEEHVVVLLAGNKSDIGPGQFKVAQQEVDEFKAKYGLEYFQVSAKEGSQVPRLFERLTELAVDRYNNAH